MVDLPTLPATTDLLNQYLRVSEAILHSQVPQEKVLAGLTTDAQYARALQGLQLVAQYHQTAMMQALTGWRHTMQEGLGIKSGGTTLPLAIKRAVLELLFLKPAMLLLSELVTPTAATAAANGDAKDGAPTAPMGASPGAGRRLPLEPQHRQFCELVQQICFHWLLAADDKVPAEHMPGLRGCILTAVTEAIGALSRVSLPMVGNPFLKYLVERVSPRRDSAGAKANHDQLRAQILRLCSGMRLVHLTMDCDEGVREAVSWLRRAHPLTHTTSQRKSQVHHALAEMFSSILWPLVRRELPHSCPYVSHEVLEEWFSLISQLKKDIWNWTTKHDKHIKDGYTLNTILVCLMDSDQYPVNVDSTAAFLIRQLKSKEQRGLVVRCLMQLIISYLVRYGKGEVVRPLLNKWLDGVVKPLLTTAKKGGLGIGELLEMIAPIAELAPEYAVGTIILDLLTSQVPDCTLASLRALYGMVTTVPAPLAPLLTRATDAFDTSVIVDTLSVPVPINTKNTQAAASSRGVPQAGGGVQSGAGVLELLRRGMHPFDLLGIGHLLPKVTGALAKLLSMWHMWYGTNAAYNSPENFNRERSTNVAMFCWLIRLIPYSKPDLWSNCKPLDMLPSYITHCEPSIRSTAHDAVLALVKGHPHLRNMMLVSYVSCLSNLNDDQHQLVRAGLVALRNLARAWALCLSERAHARGGGTGCGDISSWLSAPGASTNKESGAPGTPSAASSNTSRGAEQGGVLAPGTLHRVWWCCELSGPDALLLDVHRLEGFTMGRGLVSADEGIRREALQFLETLRSLHRALLEAQPYTSPPPPSLLPELLAQGRALLGAGMGADVSTMANTQGHMRNTSAGGASSISSHPTHRRGGSTLAGGGSSSDSSAWLEGNMQVGGGEGPQCPGPKGLATMVDPPNLTYLLDIIEQGGEHMVRSAFWDCGDWSDLWQACRPMPHKMPSLEALLCSATRDDVARLRLSRVLIALASTTATLSPLTAAAAAHELCAGRLMRMLARDVAANRLVLPGEYMSGKRADAWRHAACMAAALPTSLRDSLMDRLSPLGPHPPGGRDGSLVASSVSSLTGAAGGRGRSRGLEIRDLVRALLGLAVMVGSGPAALQLAPLMALGHLHHEHYPILVEELVPVMEEYSQIRPAKAKPSGLLNLLVTSVQRGDGNDDASRTSIGARSRPDEARRVVAHVFRIVAGAAPREALEAGAKSSNPKLPTLRTRMVEWMRDTYFHLRPMTLVQDGFWDNVQVAYCLASAVRSSALSISDALNEPLMPGKGGEGSNHMPPSLVVKGDRDSSQTSKGSGGLSFRKALYELLRFWSCEGFSTEESYSNNVRSGIAAVLNRYRQSYEDNALEPVRAELAQAGQYLDHAARTGMAALLAGPVFDADARRPQGPVLQWIERLLTHRGRIGTTSISAHPNQQHLVTTSITQSGTSAGAQGKVAGPERQEVARTALHNLLHANLDMFATCLDKCYDANRVVASSFFQVICEVYATQSTVHIAPHVMLSLILYKMVDEARDVREDSLHMLHVLSQREWGVSSGKQANEDSRLSLDTGEGAGNSEEDGAGRSTDEDNSESSESSDLGGTGGDAVVVLGNLQDSYQQFQYQLSCKLARDHLELSEALCEEMMTRALECWDSTIQHPVLICLAPWMENLVISPHWKGSWCERLLKSMYYVTQRHGPAFPFEIERLWSTLAASKRNIIPILDFLTSLGVYAALQESASLTEYFGVAKRIALYLARISPQHTIDHLAYEINLQVHEDDGSVVAAPGTPMPLSFADITGPESITGMGVHRAQSSQGMPNPSIDVLDTLMARHNTDALQLQGLFEHSSGLDSSGPGEDVAAGPLGMRSSHSAVEPDMQRSSNMDGVQRTPTSSILEGSVARSAPSAAGGTAAAMVSAEGPTGSTSGAPPSLERVPSENSVRSSPSGASGSIIEKSGDRCSPTNGVQAWGGTIRNLGNLATISVRTGDEPMIERSLQSESIADPMQDNYDTASTNSTAFAAGGGGGQGVGVRALLSRPELALCLLAEVAYEHDEDFRPHMPLLLHACICVLDQEGDIEGDHGSSGCTVSAHAQQLLMHLLYSVSARYIEAATDAGEAAECPQVSVLIRYLLSMRGRRLWAYEDADPSVCPTEGGANASLPSAAALSAMVAAVHNALAFEVGLQASWAEASLDWALHCRSRHLSCRSFQVFRALHPQLTSDVCCTLLVALQHCFAAAATASSVARVSTSGQLGGGTTENRDRAALERVDSAAWGRPSTSTRTAIIEQAGPPLTTCLACAQEVITTLKSLIEGLDSNGRLVIYPQLFWVALALLHSSSVPLYGHALSLLDVVMSRLKLHQSKVAAVLLASAPTIPGLQAAGPVQQAAVLQSIWAGLTAAGRQRSGMVTEVEEEEEQPELWLLGVAPLGMMPYFQHHFDSPLGCGSPFSANESKDSQGANPVSCSVDWGSSPAGLGVRYAPLAIQQLLLRGLLVGDTAAASLRTLSAFADALAQQGYAASEHQRRRLRSSTSPSTSIDTAASATSKGSTLQSPASVTGTVRAKGRPGSSVWGSDMGITGTLRHTPSAFTSSVAQHELLRQAIAHNSGNPSASSANTIRGGDKGGGQSSWGETVGSNASLRPFDSLQAHASLRMDAHQSLLGPWQGQLFVSLVGVLQVMASLQSARAPSVVESTSTSGHTKGTHAHTSSTANASATSPSYVDSATAGPRRDGPTLSALVQCLSSLTYAAAAHGLPALAAALNGGVAAVGAGCTSYSMPATAAAASPPFALSPAGGVPSLDMALQSICAEMARALFPRFALLFIHHCLEELTAPGLFPQAHIAAITLLRSMMLQATASLTTPPSPVPSAPDATTSISGRSSGGMPPTPAAGPTSGTPQKNLRGGPGGIDLGPSVVASLTNSSLLAPLVERTQGPLAPHAVSALSAVMAYTTQLQQYQQQQQQAPRPSSKPSSTSQPGTPGAESAHPPPIVLRTLQPPPGSDATVAAAVKRVADTMGGMSARRGRRTARIIPYLNPMGYSEKLHQQQMSQH